MEPISKQHGKYSGVLQAIACMVREERIPALWKGHVPAQALSIVQGTFQVRLPETTKMVGENL